MVAESSKFLIRRVTQEGFCNFHKFINIRVYINTDSHMWLNSKSEAEQKIIDFVILQRREMCQDDLITLYNELRYEQMIMQRPWISFDMVNVWFYWHVKEEFNQRLKRSCYRLQPICQASVEQFFEAQALYLICNWIYWNHLQL